jgi:hypothetical protein
MLDIAFYSQDREAVETVELSERFYSWLIHSEFSKIGISEEQEMQGDGERINVPVVLLEGENRQKFSDFFRDAIVQESDTMLNELGNSPSKEDYMHASATLRNLQSMRKLVENEKFKYFSRL